MPEPPEEQAGPSEWGIRRTEVAQVPGPKSINSKLLHPDHFKQDDDLFEHLQSDAMAASGDNGVGRIKTTK